MQPPLVYIVLVNVLFWFFNFQLQFLLQKVKWACVAKKVMRKHFGVCLLQSWEKFASPKVF